MRVVKTLLTTGLNELRTMSELNKEKGTPGTRAPGRKGVVFFRRAREA